MSHAGTTAHTPTVSDTRPEVHTKMPQALIVIFLLFFAVLAFAWFYVQRAKARDVVATAADTSAGSVTTDAAAGASTDTSEHVHTADDEHDHPH